LPGGGLWDMIVVMVGVRACLVVVLGLLAESCGCSERHLEGDAGLDPATDPEADGETGPCLSSVWGEQRLFQGRLPSLVWADGEAAIAYRVVLDGDREVAFSRIEEAGAVDPDSVVVSHAAGWSSHPALAWSGTRSTRSRDGWSLWPMR